MPLNQRSVFQQNIKQSVAELIDLVFFDVDSVFQSDPAFLCTLGVLCVSAG